MELIRENRGLKSSLTANQIKSDDEAPSTNIVHQERVIKELKQKVSYQEQKIETLEKDVIAKQMDRDLMRQQINAQSLSPLHFLNDHSREQFWKLLDSCRDQVLEGTQFGESSDGKGPQKAAPNRAADLKLEIERLKGVVHT